MLAKRNRVAIVKLMVALLALTGLTSPAHAAITKGSACKKLGATVIVGGLKYSCVKSGKKLVWRKGVKVVNPPSPISNTSAVPGKAPVPASTPIAVATPTPIDSETVGLGETIDISGTVSTPIADLASSFQLVPKLKLLETSYNSFTFQIQN